MEATGFDYMKQFWRENEIQTFSARETQLYFFLLSECNRHYWHNPFECSTQRITNNLNLSRQTLCRLRMTLQERGLISYQEGKNSLTQPSYVLMMKSKKWNTKMVSDINGTLKMTQDGTLNGTLDGTNIKTYKTDNTKDNISISKDELLPLDKLKSLLSSDKEWLDNVREYTNRLGTESDETSIEKQLDAYFLYLQTSGIQSKSVADAQKHFVNWLVKRKTDRTNWQKPLKSRQVGVKLTDNSPDKFKDITGW